jgi:hypothetical protein
METAMSEGLPGLLKTRDESWNETWGISPPNVPHQHFDGDAGKTAGPSSVLLGSEHHTPSDSAPIQRTRRPSSVLIFVGALWISVGMIVSAAIVTVAFLI